MRQMSACSGCSSALSLRPCLPAAPAALKTFRCCSKPHPLAVSSLFLLLGCEETFADTSQLSLAWSGAGAPSTVYE